MQMSASQAIRVSSDRVSKNDQLRIPTEEALHKENIGFALSHQWTGKFWMIYVYVGNSIDGQVAAS